MNSILSTLLQMKEKCFHGDRTSIFSNIISFADISQRYGQLGLGDSDQYQSSPQEIIDFRAEVVSDIYAGGDAKRGFSFALTGLI